MPSVLESLYGRASSQHEGVGHMHQRRKIGIDARVSVEGTAYEIEPDLVGETVSEFNAVVAHSSLVDPASRVPRATLRGATAKGRRDAQK